jgi:hypothetical protein
MQKTVKYWLNLSSVALSLCLGMGCGGDDDAGSKESGGETGDDQGAGSGDGANGGGDAQDGEGEGEEDECPEGSSTCTGASDGSVPCEDGESCLSFEVEGGETFYSRCTRNLMSKLWSQPGSELQVFCDQQAPEGSEFEYYKVFVYFPNPVAKTYSTSELEASAFDGVKADLNGFNNEGSVSLSLKWGHAATPFDVELVSYDEATGAYEMRVDLTLMDENTTVRIKGGLSGTATP